MLESLVLKNRSTEVIIIPPSSSTMNDCARGSYQPICLVSVLVEFVNTLSSLTVSRTISAFLIARMFSLTVCNVPVALYSTSADESTVPGVLSFEALVVNLIVLVPVDQRGLESILGDGI